MSLDLNPDLTRQPSITDRRAWTIAALLLVGHAILCWLSRDLGILLMRDDARYLFLAASLGQGGYHDLFLATPTAHSLYPPGLPALLLAWGSAFGQSFDGYVVMNVLLSVSGLALVFAAVKRIWGPLIGLACLVPLCVSPLLVLRAGGLRSETAYMFFSIVAVWALSRAKPATQTLIVAGLAALMTAATRTVGVTLLAAIILHWVLQKRYRAAVILTFASALTIGAWIAWTVVAPQQHAGSNYLGDLAAVAAGEDPDWRSILWRRTGIRLWRYFGRTLPGSLPAPTVPGTPIDNLVFSLLIGSGLLAGWLVLLKRWRVVSLYLGFYAAALMGYPFMRSRFLEPIIPLLIVGLFVGIGALVARLRPDWATRAIVVLAVIFTISGAVRLAPRTALRMSCGPFDLENPPSCLADQQSSFLQAAHYVSQNTQPTDLFITKMPETLYYYAGRRSIQAKIALTARPESFLDYLEEQGASWALLTAGSPTLGSLLSLHCTDLEVEKVFHRRTVLFRLPDDALPAAEKLDRDAAEACVALDAYMSDYSRDARGMAIE